MAPGLSDGVGSRWQPHGDATFRTNGHGGLVVVIPTHCPSGRHMLTEGGYDASEGEYPGGNFGRILRIACRACNDIPHADYAWSLMTRGRHAASAEFDDDPYADLVAKHRDH